MTEEVLIREDENVMDNEAAANLEVAPEVVQPEETPKPERNPEEWVTENFKWAEFTHSATAVARGLRNVPNDAERKNIKRVAELLEQIRAYLSKKYGRTVGIRISSGFRSAAVNRAVGGSSTSAHLVGLAADIHASGLSPNQLAYDIQEMMGKGLIKLDQIIRETPRGSNGWVHVGLRQGSLRGEKLTYAYSSAARRNVYTAVKSFSNPNIA